MLDTIRINDCRTFYFQVFFSTNFTDFVKDFAHRQDPSTVQNNANLVVQYRGVRAKKVYVYICKEALRTFSLSLLGMILNIIRFISLQLQDCWKYSFIHLNKLFEFLFQIWRFVNRSLIPTAFAITFLCIWTLNELQNQSNNNASKLNFFSPK